MSAPRREDPAVEALAAAIEPIIDYSGDLLWSESQGPRARNVARTVLAAIARNEVPGVTLAADREPDGLRAAQAAALREAAEDFATGAWADAWGADGVEDDISAVRSTERWLLARADALAAHPATDQPEVDRG